MIGAARRDPPLVEPGLARAAAVLGVLVGCAGRPPPPDPHGPAARPVRVSRPAAGTIVGVTLARGTPADAEPAFAAIEAGEAAMSEWRPASVAAALARGEARPLLAPERAIFVEADAARIGSAAAFDVCWKGGAVELTAEGARLRECPGLDLGGVLKGWLADRAAAALLAAGVDDFVVDVGGDLVARGDAGDGAKGWAAHVVVAGRTFPVRLRDEALSTASQEQQPGHIRDARSGAPATTLAGVYVRAPTGLVADTWDTATFAAGRRLALPVGACAVLVGADGTVDDGCAHR